MSELEEMIKRNHALFAENERLKAEVESLRIDRNALANLVKDMDDYINTRGAHGEQ